MQYSSIPVRGWWFGSWRAFQQPLSPTVPLIPDGYFELGSAGGFRAVFVEVDLGTEAVPVLAKKASLYLQLAASGEFSQIFGRSQFRVLLITTSERRLQNIRAAIAKMTDKIFWLGTLDLVSAEKFWSAVLAPSNRRPIAIPFVKSLCAIATTATKQRPASRCSAIPAAQHMTPSSARPGTSIRAGPRFAPSAARRDLSTPAPRVPWWFRPLLLSASLVPGVLLVLLLVLAVIGVFQAVLVQPGRPRAAAGSHSHSGAALVAVPPAAPLHSKHVPFLMAKTKKRKRQALPLTLADDRARPKPSFRGLYPRVPRATPRAGYLGSCPQSCPTCCPRPQAGSAGRSTSTKLRDLIGCSPWTVRQKFLAHRPSVLPVRGQQQIDLLRSIKLSAGSQNDKKQRRKNK